MVSSVEVFEPLKIENIPLPRNYIEMKVI